MAIKTLAGMTRLNSSSVEAESHRTGIFLIHRRTNKRKPNLPVAVWWFLLFFFLPTGIIMCLDWILWGLATQVTQKRTFWKRCSNISSSVAASLTHPHLFVTVYWALSSLPLRINTFLFDILCEHFVIFSWHYWEVNVSLQLLNISGRMSWQAFGWLTGVSGHLPHLGLSREKMHCQHYVAVTISQV